jgi:hypothetical protein
MLKFFADVAELVDALASGASESNLVEVQVLSSAPLNEVVLMWRLFVYSLTVLPSRIIQFSTLA